MLTRRSEIRQWLAQLEQQARQDLEPSEIDALAALLGEVGLSAYLKLAFAAQLGWQKQLSTLSLHEPRNVTLATVLQGQIKAVDLLASALLEMLPDTQPDA